MREAKRRARDGSTAIRVQMRTTAAMEEEFADAFGNFFSGGETEVRGRRLSEVEERC